MPAEIPWSASRSRILVRSRSRASAFTFLRRESDTLFARDTARCARSGGRRPMRTAGTVSPVERASRSLTSMLMPTDAAGLKGRSSTSAANWTTTRSGVLTVLAALDGFPHRDADGAPWATADPGAGRAGQIRDEAPEPPQDGPGHPQRIGRSVWSAAPRDGWKRSFDLCALAFGAVLLLPAWILLLPAVALAVRLDGPGPVLLRQARLGRHGRVFGMLKFRTMADGAERDTGPAWSPPDDPRVTRVGRVLRRWHLDELPQAVNVLCGEMSLVGPRPERPELAAVVEQEVPGFAAPASRRRGAPAGGTRHASSPSTWPTSRP